MSAGIERMIDHALLHPTMTDDEIRAGCRLAAELQLMSVCVKPYAVPLAVAELQGTTTCVGTVIGFPHGSAPTEVKVAEAVWAMNYGAVELDMVINIGKAIQGDWDYITQDIKAVVDVAHARQMLVKVIFETDFVTEEDTKRKLCEICDHVGADFVKTSTGFGFVKQADGSYNYRGATTADIALMRQVCSPQTGVKASGGVRSFQEAQQYIALGATRLGTSASAAIVRDQGHDEKSY